MNAIPSKRTGKQCVSITLPELLQLSKGARKLSLSALHIKSPLSGFRLSRLLSRGMEFAENRRYQAGDDIRNIDWRVTARTGKVHTKLFSEEKEKPVFLCADMRSSMFFATKGVYKSVQTALMMGYIAWNAAQSGHRLGGMIFDDFDHYEFKPMSGKRGLLPFLQRLAQCAEYTADNKTGQRIPTLEHTIANIKRVASPGSFIFIMSDFRHLTPDSRDLLIQLSKHSDLSLCLIYDPFEAVLPKNGTYPITNGREELQLNSDDKRLLEQYHRQFNERREQVASLNHQHHIHFMECSTEDDCFEILKEHFS